MKDAKMANYAEDNTICAVEGNIDDLLKTLEKETTVILNWFKINEIKSNDDSCHLIVCNQENVSVTLGNETIEKSNSLELLGDNIDTYLIFDELHALARISKYLNEDKLKIIMKTFIQSQFNYFPIVWMFHNRTLNNKINKLPAREGFKNSIQNR